MLCPLLLTGDLASRMFNASNAECKQEICAWWDDEAEKCAMLSLAQALGTINFNVAGLTEHR